MNSIQNNEIYRQAFNASSDILVLIDKKANIIDANNKLLEIGGYQKDEIIGKNIKMLSGIFTVKSVALMLKNFAKRMMGEEIKPYNVEAKTKDKRNLFLRINATIFADDNNKKIGEIVSLHDITDLVKKEKEINISREYYKTLLGTAPDGVVITDLEGKIKEVNNEILEKFGYTKEELLGKNFCLFVCEKNKKEKPCQNVLHNRVLRKIRIGLKRKDQTIFIGEISSSEVSNLVNAVIITIRDVTKEAKAEEDLKESEEKYRSLVENAIDYIFQIDPNYRVQSINISAQKALSLRASDIEGKRIDEIFPPEIAKRYISSLEKVFKTGKALVVEDSKMIVGNNLSWLSVTLSPIKKADGRVASVIGVCHDITEEKKAEERIQKSEQRYAELFSNIKNAVAIYAVKNNGQDIIVKDFNPAAEKIEKVKLEDIIGKNIVDVFSGVEKFGILDVFKRVNETGQPEHFPLGRYKDKRIIGWRDNYIYKLKNGDIVAIYEDKTKEKQDEQKLKESQEKYQEVFDNANDPIYLNELFSDGAFGNFLDVNNAALKQLGYTKNEMLKMSPRDIDVLDPKQKIFEKVSKQLLEKKHAIFETIHQTKDSRRIPVQLSIHLFESGDKNIALAIARDFTERKKYETQLKSQKEILDQEKNKIEIILRSIGDGAFVVDEKKRIIIFNKIAEQISGYNEGEVLNKPYKEILKFIIEKKGKENAKFIEKSFSTGKIQEMTNHTLLIRKDGRELPVADSSAPLRSKEGKIVGCVVVFRDVAKEREIEKMKSEFVSISSHQLRTPLTSIKWLLEMMLKGDVGKITKEQKKHLQDVYNMDERMIILVNDLLNVSRIEAGKIKIEPKEVKIEDILSRVVENLKPLSEKKKINVLCLYAKEKLPKMFIDPERIEEAFKNIISNSIKYTKDGGKVEVSCKRIDHYVEFAIKDNGVGIPKDQQKRVFEKFFRADNIVRMQTEGTGLGLYITKSIIESSGGKIWFESEEGKGLPAGRHGATFFLALPIKNNLH